METNFNDQVKSIREYDRKLEATKDKELDELIYMYIESRLQYYETLTDAFVEVYKSKNIKCDRKRIGEIITSYADNEKIEMTDDEKDIFSVITLNITEKTFKYGEYVIHEYLFDNEKEYLLKCEELSQDNICYSYYKPINQYNIYQWVKLDSLPPDYNEISEDNIMGFSSCYTFWFSEKIKENPKLIDTFNNDFVKEGYDSPLFYEGVEPENMESYQGNNEANMLDNIAGDITDGLDLDDILNKRSGIFIGRYKYSLEKVG